MKIKRKIKIIMKRKVKMKVCLELQYQACSRIDRLVKLACR
jgi:hypothetical protein